MLRHLMRFAPRLAPYLLGLLGALTIYVGYHLFQDHAHHHQMVEWHLRVQQLQTQQASPMQQRPVTPPPSVHPSPEQK